MVGWGVGGGLGLGLGGWGAGWGVGGGSGRQEKNNLTETCRSFHRYHNICGLSLF